MYVHNFMKVEVKGSDILHQFQAQKMTDILADTSIKHHSSRITL